MARTEATEKAEDIRDFRHPDVTGYLSWLDAVEASHTQVVRRHANGIVFLSWRVRLTFCGWPAAMLRRLFRARVALFQSGLTLGPDRSSNARIGCGSDMADHDFFNSL